MALMTDAQRLQTVLSLLDDPYVIRVFSSAGVVIPRLRNTLEKRLRELTSGECDECGGNGFYWIYDERRACICSEPQE